MKQSIALLVLASMLFAECEIAPAAEATTGTIAGSVSDSGGAPVVNGRISALSPSGRYFVLSDSRGRFMLLGLPPDSYTLSVEAAGFEAVNESGVAVLPGQTAQTSFRLAKALRTLARVRASSAFNVGSTTDSFTVSGGAARAIAPPVSSSGLGAYSAGSVQGAIASVPGVNLDSFANAILRGGKVDDAVFNFDSVPVPQGLIAEPGGNIVGAQLPTTGIASTTVTLAGYQTQGDNALGGVIDQIPAVGTYPGSSTLELSDGVGARYQLANLQVLGATRDLKWRYALASTLASEDFSYGDGHSFYPVEAATYGVALKNRGQFSTTANVHYRLDQKNDFSVLSLVGEANYDQYGTPFSGETIGQFNGSRTPYPGEANQAAPVTFPSRVRGTYDIVKAQWLHTGAHALSRVQLYQSQFGSTAGGPYWDENGFPNGAFSLLGHQGGREEGLGYDGDDAPGDHHHLRFGAEYRINNSFLDQVVPTADERVRSNPTLFSALAYFGDTYSPSSQLDVTGTARLTRTHVVPSDGFIYDVAALDPHFGATYKVAGYALRATFDHTTVAPKPLEADRSDSSNVDPAHPQQPASFVPLASETANVFTYSFEGGRRTQFRATYYQEFEKNRIDVLPVNYRTAAASGAAPSAIGVPANVGQLRASGAELYLKNGGFILDTNLVRGFSSSASQFAFNSLNAAAIAANHLFPIGYVPDFTTTLSYEFDAARRRLRFTPSLSYATGYPYGNGRKIWIFDPVTNKPIQVPNDNNRNPGYNYYFLRDPSKPYDATANPYIGTLGTPEGDDPNTLRSAPQTYVNLHLEGDLTPRLTAIVDVANLFGNFSPTAEQGNPYLIGPPGYAGGNPAYARWYGQQIGSPVYTLGNGVPTNNGVTSAVPWAYGRAGYVPQSFPLGRTLQVRLRYRI